ANNVVEWIRSLFGNADERQLRRLLARTFDDEGTSRTFTQRMLDLVSEVELNADVSGVASGGAKIKATDSSATGQHLQVLNQILQIAKAMTRPEALSANYHILIDDLDLHWRDTPLQNAFIGALFLSVRKLASSPHIKCVVSLRDV